MISAFDHGCSIKSHRGGEGHPQAGLGGVQPRQGRGHQEGVGDEGHGREEEERLRGGARQRADSGDAGKNIILGRAFELGQRLLFKHCIVIAYAVSCCLLP